MSQEIRIRADIRDQYDREFTCELSSSALKMVGSPMRSASSQFELARLMGEMFRVLSQHLLAPPNDHIILNAFASAALNSELEFPE
jgi:hypothetical protein